jgi:hypothetical protein
LPLARIDLHRVVVAAEGDRFICRPGGQVGLDAVKRGICGGTGQHQSASGFVVVPGLVRVILLRDYVDAMRVAALVFFDLYEGAPNGS